MSADDLYNDPNDIPKLNIAFNKFPNKTFQHLPTGEIMGTISGLNINMLTRFMGDYKFYDEMLKCGSISIY